MVPIKLVTILYYFILFNFFKFIILFECFIIFLRYLELIFHSGLFHYYFGYVYYIMLSYIIIVYLCSIPYF